MMSDCVLGLQYETRFKSEYSKLKALGIPIIGNERFTKLEQYLLLSRFDILTPKTYYDVDTISTFSCYDTFNAYVDLERFCIKPSRGARGVGVKSISKEEFADCWCNKELVPEVFNKEMAYAKTQEVDDYYIKDTFSGNDWVIQDIIDIKREFRLLFFCDGDYLIYERNRKKGEFLGNISVAGKPKEVDTETERLILDELKPKLLSLMKDVNYPWASTDVYIDNDDNIGIIEFQMEFAYKGFNSVQVRDKLVKSVNYCIENKGV